MVTFGSRIFEIKWTMTSASTSPVSDTGGAEVLSGSFHRVTAGDQVESCRFTEKASAITDQMPDAIPDCAFTRREGVPAVG